MPVLSFHAWPGLYSLFFASVPVFSFVACPWLCCLFSALLPVRGFVACSRLCRLSSTFFPVLSILASLGFVAISYVRPPPPPFFANFAQNPGGGAPTSSKMCKKFLRGDPYYSLHISEEGGGPPRECAKLACLVKLYTTPPSILTLVTWVQCTQAWPSANSARRLAFGQPNPTVCSLACRWRLRSALRADQVFFY